jgi:hypothetical protein
MGLVAKATYEALDLPLEEIQGSRGKKDRHLI